MKKQILALVLSSFVSLIALARGTQRFPLGPDPELTPGALCEKADTYRYPEHIKYCSRSVESETKWQIIDTYDKQLGYTIRQQDRTDFKIDHYIPLCMGGSNDISNLWPQHKTVYVKTDALEEKLCRLMDQGKVTQSEAVETIKRVKNDLGEADQVSSDINSRLD